MESNQRLIINRDIGACNPFPVSEPSPLDYPNYRLMQTDTEFVITPISSGEDQKSLVIDKQTLKIHLISKIVFR